VAEARKGNTIFNKRLPAIEPDRRFIFQEA
jgi:hypothetical protein